MKNEGMTIMRMMEKMIKKGKLSKLNDATRTRSTRSVKQPGVVKLAETAASVKYSSPTLHP